MLRVGSLFSGIGGIELGLERAGMRTAFFVENDPFYQQVLMKHWPNTWVWGDITTLDFSRIAGESGPVDVVSGGFPCQPFSQAGKGRGVQDDRWLWPHFARAVRDLRPSYVLVENVPALRWRGRGALHIVLGDLASMGFDAEWASIRAADVGAPHLRERLFVAAHPRSSELRLEPGWWHGEGGASTSQPGVNGATWTASHPHGAGLSQRRDGGVAQSSGEDRWADESSGRSGVFPYADGERLPSRAQRDSQPQPRRQAWTCWHDTDGCGCATWWDAEPPVGRVANGIPRRVDRLRALGNAVVPQVAELVGRRIVEHAGTRVGPL